MNKIFIKTVKDCMKEQRKSKQIAQIKKSKLRTNYNGKITRQET